MKKQIGLISLIIALTLSFMAFSGVASAQASNVQIAYFGQPYCSACQQVHPIVVNEAAKYGVRLVEYDVTDAMGKGVAQANTITETPTIIVSGAQTTRLQGYVTQEQIDQAIKAAIGPTPPPHPNPYVAPKATQQTPFKAPTTPKASTTMQKAPSAAPSTKPQTTPTPRTQQPNIAVVQPTTQTQTQTTTTPTQTVPEFSLLGLGAPALIVGAIYLFMRRK
ncbi:MAG: thioredoxin family protein [Halobacteriota archaeon]